MREQECVDRGIEGARVRGRTRVLNQRLQAPPPQRHCLHSCRLQQRQSSARTREARAPAVDSSHATRATRSE